MALKLDEWPSTSVTLRLTDTDEESHRGFLVWREHLLAGAVKRNGNDYIGNVGFRDLHPDTGKIDIELWVGDSEHAAVQINEPNDPTKEDGLAAIAFDAEGHRVVHRELKLAAKG